MLDKALSSGERGIRNEETTAYFRIGRSFFLVLPKCDRFYFLMVKPKIIW